VRVLADAVVVEEAMSVAEFDALGDKIHVNISSYFEGAGAA
jgi:hypothetical protein